MVAVTCILFQTFWLNSKLASRVVLVATKYRLVCCELSGQTHLTPLILCDGLSQLVYVDSDDGHSVVHCPETFVQTAPYIVLFK